MQLQTIFKISSGSKIQILVPPVFKPVPLNAVKCLFGLLSSLSAISVLIAKNISPILLSTYLDNGDTKKIQKEEEKGNNFISICKKERNTREINATVNY